MLLRKLRKKKAITIVPRIIIKESAFITGEIPYLTIEKTYKGKVVEPGPDTKKVITKSSRDMVTDIIKPEIIPGMMAGIITLKRVCFSVAPRS